MRTNIKQGTLVKAGSTLTLVKCCVLVSALIIKKNQHVKLFKQKYNKSVEYEEINYYKKHQLIKLFYSNINYKRMGLRDCIYK